ncbi:hypothetical protein [Variovorax boronicumulans]|uniref:hypothetical protein n=1 Tax=Variovorax boronicumulans TaxID=436515 RepID=UPI001C59979E
MKILKAGCACRPPSLERLERSPWMRLLPGLRAYHCPSCGQSFLASKREVTDIMVSHRQRLFTRSHEAADAARAA